MIRLNWRLSWAAYDFTQMPQTQCLKVLLTLLEILLKKLDNLQGDINSCWLFQRVVCFWFNKLSCLNDKMVALIFQTCEEKDMFLLEVGDPSRSLVFIVEMLTGTTLPVVSVKLQVLGPNWMARKIPSYIMKSAEVNC